MILELRRLVRVEIIMSTPSIMRKQLREKLAEFAALKEEYDDAVVIETATGQKTFKHSKFIRNKMLTRGRFISTLFGKYIKTQTKKYAWEEKRNKYIKQLEQLNKERLEIASSNDRLKAQIAIEPSRIIVAKKENEIFSNIIRDVELANKISRIETYKFKHELYIPRNATLGNDDTIISGVIIVREFLGKTHLKETRQYEEHKSLESKYDEIASQYSEDSAVMEILNGLRKDLKADKIKSGEPEISKSKYRYQGGMKPAENPQYKTPSISDIDWSKG
jgi:hypothetical protein